MNIPLVYFLGASAALFSLGLYGALRRTNTITVLMCIELMLNAVNLNFITFSRFITSNGSQVAGQVFAVFVMAVGAAEVAVGLAIILAWVRRRRRIDINEINMLKG